MSILFTILKIIGIILLIIFAVVLFLILMLLFHPVYYRVSGEIQEKISVSGHVTWLLGIFWFSYQVLDKELYYTVRIFGIPIMKRPSRKKKTPVTEDDVLDEMESLDEAVRSDREPGIPEAGLSEEAHGEDESPQEEDTHISVEDSLEQQKKHKRQSQRREQKSGNRFFSMLQRLNQEWQDERNHSAINHVFQELKYMIRHMKPKDIRSELTFSTGDPALTGQALGLVSLFPHIFQYKIHIYPDFLAEEWYVRGTFMIHGHLMLVYPCISLLRMFKDKNIKRLIKKIKN